jgi:four helix bundle protein
METETFLLLALRLGYVVPEAADATLALVVEISKMLTTLRRRLE